MKLYIVVAFPFNYVEELIKWKKEEEEYIQKMQAPDYIPKPRVKLEDKPKEELLEFIERFSAGQTRNTGYFSSLEAAKEAIKTHPDHLYSLSECGYYTYLCIEEVDMNYLDVYGDDALSWYKLSEGEYQECQKPDWAEGIIGWS